MNFHTPEQCYLAARVFADMSYDIGPSYEIKHSPYASDERIQEIVKSVQKKIDEVSATIAKTTDPAAIKTLKEYAAGLNKAKEIILDKT